MPGEDTLDFSEMAARDSGHVSATDRQARPAVGDHRECPFDTPGATNILRVAQA